MNDFFSLHCSKCGYPLEYDIISQNYHCASCGSDTLASEVTKSANKRNAEFDADQKIKLTKARDAHSVFSCQSCGASIMIAENELAGHCDFCGTPVTKNDFSGAQFPQGIIPFFITKDEAVDAFNKWAEKNSRIDGVEQTAKSIADTLVGYYLPYQMIRGPIRLDFSHDGDQYTCGGYLDGIFVSQTAKMDNLVMDAAEPFDTSDIVPFDFAFTAGRRMLLPDISLDEVMDRTVEETGSVYSPFVAETFGNTKRGFRISQQYETETNLILNTVYLPMYVMRIDGADGKWLVINGQTGRVAYGTRDDIHKSAFGFMKRDVDGVLEKEYREFPQYQPKRPLYYKTVTEEIGYNIGKHKMRRVVTGYKDVLRAGLYEKDLVTGNYVFKTKFAKYANGGAGSDNEIYFGENFQKDIKKRNKSVLLLTLVLGLLVLPFAIWLFVKLSHKMNGDFDIEQSANRPLTAIELCEPGYYIGFVADKYHEKPGKGGRSESCMVQFRHVDGQMVSVKYESLKPMIMPKRFFVFRPIGSSDGFSKPWLIEPESDKVRHLMQGGPMCVFRKYDNGGSAICRMSDDEAFSCLINYQSYYPAQEQSQPNYYEPE